VDRVLRGDLLDDVVASLEAADRDARMVEFEESSA